MKINTLFDTGAMKSVMSWKMYQKLKLNDLDTASIPHVVGASGESLGARGRTKCEININGRIFYQTFIVCEHLTLSLLHFFCYLHLVLSCMDGGLIHLVIGKLSFKIKSFCFL